MVKKTAFIIFVFFLFFPFGNVFAQESFSTYCRLGYRFFDNGNASVIQEISLINQKPDVYVSEYTLTLTDEEIENIKAWDSFGPIEVSQSVSNKTTTINLRFNQKVVGKNQALSFILKYDAKKLAKKEGNIWRILLPKLKGKDQFIDYTLEVKVPSSFGSLASSFPSFSRLENDQNFQTFIFEGVESLNNGVFLEFGPFQIFNFELTYQLENHTGNKVLQKIAVPFDSPYQSVDYLRIEPEPENLNADDDGNWLADYYLNPWEKIEIKVDGKVKIFPAPINKNFVSGLGPKNYLGKELFWEVEDEKIKKITKDLKTPKEIYDFVVKTLDYNYEKAKEKRTRLGALGSLSSPKDALCLEFTDLFVTLARASGIPSREIEGYAYTNNPKLKPLELSQDILHAWPEYYDFEKSTWISVDPTWGKTTGGFDYFKNFDMSHFAFVVHGGDSQSPPPPGSYKFLNSEKKNIFVNYGKDFSPSEEKLSVNLNAAKPYLFSKNAEIFLKIENQGFRALYNLPVKVEEKNLTNKLVFEKNIPFLLPYEKISFPVDIHFPSRFFLNKNLNFLIEVGNFQTKESISFVFWQVRTFLLLLPLLFVVLIFVYIFIIRRKKL